MPPEPQRKSFPFDLIPPEYKPPKGMKLVAHPLLGLVWNDTYNTVREVPKKRDNLRLSGTGLRVFFGVAKRLGLEEPQQMALLGIRSKDTLARYKAGEPVRLRNATLERISHFLVIYEALACFISDPAAFLGWMRRPNPNPQFENNPPLDVITYADTKKLLELRLWSLSLLNGG